MGSRSQLSGRVRGMWSRESNFSKSLARRHLTPCIKTEGKPHLGVGALMVHRKMVLCRAEKRHDELLTPRASEVEEIVFQARGTSRHSVEAGIIGKLHKHYRLECGGPGVMFIWSISLHIQ